MNILCDRSGVSIDEGLAKINKNKDLTINLFIGPEGGFLTDEIFLAEQNGFLVMNLNSAILRAETAAIVASFIVSNPLF